MHRQTVADVIKPLRCRSNVEFKITVTSHFYSVKAWWAPPSQRVLVRKWNRRQQMMASSAFLFMCVLTSPHTRQTFNYPQGSWCVCVVSPWPAAEQHWPYTLTDYINALWPLDYPQWDAVGSQHLVCVELNSLSSFEDLPTHLLPSQYIFAFPNLCPAHYFEQQIVGEKHGAVTRPACKRNKQKAKLSHY